MKSLRDLSIGVIDSGIGGLSVLNALVKKFPTESFIYYGDNENAPYGNKPLNYIKRRLFYMIDELNDVKIKGLVVACNTLSTHFYPQIKNYCSYFVIPTLPPLIKGDGVYLACTSNTAKSSYAIKNYGKNIISFPCLAKTIEDNVFSLDKFSVTPYFEKLNEKVETLVLGCTHYSFISKNINEQLKIKTVDGYDKILSLLSEELNVRSVRAKNSQCVNFIGSAKNTNKIVFEKVFGYQSG